LLGDFNAKVRIESILKQSIRNNSLYEVINDDGVRVVNLATSKNLIVKSTQCSQTTTFINTLGLLMGKCTD